jgi:hypothetical protein
VRAGKGSFPSDLSKEGTLSYAAAQGAQGWTWWTRWTSTPCLRGGSRRSQSRRPRPVQVHHVPQVHPAVPDRGRTKYEQEVADPGPAAHMDAIRRYPRPLRSPCVRELPPSDKPGSWRRPGPRDAGWLPLAGESRSPTRPAAFLPVGRGWGRFPVSVAHFGRAQWRLAWRWDPGNGRCPQQGSSRTARRMSSSLGTA